MTPGQALATARAVTAAAGADPDERRLAAALEGALPEWDRSRCRGTAREALLLQRLLVGPATVRPTPTAGWVPGAPGGAAPRDFAPGGGAGGGRVGGGLPDVAATTPAAVVLGLCLARPADNPLWADFRRLADLLRQLEVEQRAQRRRAVFPGPPGRRAAAQARGTRAVMSRAVAGFAATWGPGGADPRTEPSER